ncbi:MAG: Gfo/Idh/MocA family oxidoreductase [Bacteroidales bacterium]|jgi:predicted dehydrogenase|nr:Gfo/Idh/MocA family oxidoreductase [Bacteroidales bacterium]
MNRRFFLRNSAFAAAAFTVVPRNVLGGTGFTAPSDQINLGVIGCGAQAGGLANAFASKANVNVVAAADVESLRPKKIQATVEKATEKAKGKAFKGFQLYGNYKEILARKDIDGVIIATPDHWHAIQTIDACRAGKDVYVEKPMSHSIQEGRLMADAVKKYNRVLQVGNMQRSWRNFRHACELVRNGYIGEIRQVQVTVGPPPVKYNLPEQPLPKTLDWENWIGPAPMNVFNDELIFMNRGGYPNWRNYKEYGGGMVCDWGAHMFDIAQWALGMDDSGPIEFIPVDKERMTPLTMRYANGTTMTHELAQPIRKSDGNSVRFIGTDGVIDISRSFLDTIPCKLQDIEIGEDKIKLYRNEDHYSDFINAIKTRKQPISTVEIGHRTASLCHIVNLCYELNRPLRWNPEKEVFFVDDEANRRLSDPIRAPFKMEV